jgi:hypothetical protein
MLTFSSCGEAAAAQAISVERAKHSRTAWKSGVGNRLEIALFESPPIETDRSGAAVLCCAVLCCALCCAEPSTAAHPTINTTTTIIPRIPIINSKR